MHIEKTHLLDQKYKIDYINPLKNGTPVRGIQSLPHKKLDTVKLVASVAPII
jgi:hypothetical protein